MTTDECYTPKAVYDAVLDWINDSILSLDGVEVVRPFYPGGDYEHSVYAPNCVVIDNPPFSILAKIRRFYHERGIKYFLFAPTLTLANGAKELDATYVIAGARVVYENKAVVNTSFITNLDCGDVKLWVAGDLNEKIKLAMAGSVGCCVKSSYIYPKNVTSAALLQRIAARGGTLKINRESVVSINRLDAMRGVAKGIYGGGWLLSDSAAKRKELVDAYQTSDRIELDLSEREREIVRSLV